MDLKRGLGNAAGLASSWADFTICCSPPAIPRPPRASQTQFHMSTTLSFYKPLGVAPLTLLVSAGGVAAASKRPFIFRVPPAVLALVSFFGGH